MIDTPRYVIKSKGSVDRLISQSIRQARTVPRLHLDEVPAALVVQNMQLPGLVHVLGDVEDGRDDVRVPDVGVVAEAGVCFCVGGGMCNVEGRGIDDE